MSTTVTVNQNKTPKLLGLIVTILGAVMLVAGLAVYIFASGYLKDERITVSADAASFAGKQVAGPFTAFAQADIINTHALAVPDVATLDPAISNAAEFAEELGNKTYAELGGIGNKYKDEVTALKSGGATDEDPAVVEAQAKADAAGAKRTSVMNGSFLRASLFTSVVSFGVATLVMGVGVVFGLTGYAIIRLSDGAVVETKKAVASE
ncbi:aromatic ring-opening dioxygenase LigA [Populibacterium corticicola]|uniref:Aromatic ring-opening dioxygenase LigA n=1 Tax=Populibacterium corticicola TaxID=1812826 RepID=A0ABW5XJ45_9MICO